jgi:hypothetical protein
MTLLTRNGFNFGSFKLAFHISQTIEDVLIYQLKKMNARNIGSDENSIQLSFGFQRLKWVEDIFHSFKKSDVIPILKDIPTDYSKTTNYEAIWCRDRDVHLMFILVRLLQNPSESTLQRFNMFTEKEAVNISENFLYFSDFLPPSYVMQKQYGNYPRDSEIEVYVQQNVDICKKILELIAEK